MEFKLWLEASDKVVLLNRRYLFDIGMSSVRVRGELYKALDHIVGDIEVRPGELGVLLDDQGSALILAVYMNMIGFVPIKTEALGWEKVGQFFDGEWKQLEKMNLTGTGAVNILSLKHVEDQLRKYPSVTNINKSANEIRATFFEPPQGPAGYRSKYQIILNNRKPGLVEVIVVIGGVTKSFHTDVDNLSNAVEGAYRYLLQNKSKKI